MNRLKLNNKKNRLELILKNFDSLMVAFSGGVDSAFLLAMAHEVLGRKVAAITATSDIHPAKEREAAIDFAKKLDIKLILLESKEMSHSDFVANSKNRCYICKKILFKDIFAIASEMGIKNIAHGANTDDLKDFRPGLKAAHELGVIAPLIDAKLTKDDIRLLSKEMHLTEWNKPSMPCLATRIPYGTPIIRQALEMVEQAEDVLFGLGFIVCRVRMHGNIARIEVTQKDFAKILDNGIRKIVISKFRTIGFSNIALDLEGYIQGSMNRP
jgi:uncharacterized protein